MSDISGVFFIIFLQSVYLESFQESSQALDFFFIFYFFTDAHLA